MAKKQATTQRGTTYTELGNGQFAWSNYPSSGMIDTINPGNSFYRVHAGSSVPPDEVPYSSEGYQEQLQTIRGLEFKEPKSWWEETKEFGRILKQSIQDKFKTKKQNGGTLTILQKDTLLRHISGF